MDAQLSPRFLRTPSFLPRITRQRGRTMEQLLAGQTLFDEGAELSGAITEAAYAATDPLVLRRLREAGVPFLIDPQSNRFSGERLVETQALLDLDYAPEVPLRADGLADLDARELAMRALAFQQEHGACAYIAPALPAHDADADAWADANHRLLEASCALNGSGSIERRPLLAQLAPGPRAVGDPEAALALLLDLPVDGAYVEPLTMNTMRDSVEKLYRYVHYLELLEDGGLPVIASRVGPFGPLLTALGISSFSSGLGDAESCNLAALNRRKTERDRERGGGGARRRVYLHPLRITVFEDKASPLLADERLRGHFSCDLGCCRYAQIDGLAGRGPSHYLWTRNAEVRRITESPTRGARVDRLHEELRNAQAFGRTVRRSQFDRQKDLPDFGHLDRWLSLLAREQQARSAA